MPDHRRLLELLEEYKRECGQDVFLKGEDGRVVASTCAPAAVLLRAAVTEQISSKELRRRAEMLGEEATGNRCLFLLETEKQDLSGVKDVVAGLFGENEKHYLIEAEPGILAAAPRMDELDPEEFRELILQSAPQADLSGEPAGWFGKAAYSDGGGVSVMEIGGVPFRGTALRSLLSLRSTWFTVAVEDGEIVFETRGNGHRVGMSQYGAQAMALEGADFREILTHYYTGVSIVRAEDGA